MAQKKTVAKKPRKLQEQRYKSFRLQKRIKSSKPKLPTIKALTLQTAAILRQNKKFFIVYALIYGVLSFLFIQTATVGINVAETKETLTSSLGAFPASLTLYTGLIGSTSQFSNQIAAIYQFVMVIIFGLAVVYGLRHMYGEDARRVSVKESLYRGMAPLIPVLLVLIVVAIEFLPLSIASSVYTTVITNGLAVTAIERILWLVMLLLSVLLTTYLVSSSIFALFIATLPDMMPMQSLRAARELVRFRRLEVIRKLIALPFILFIVMGIIIVPIILVVPVLAQPVFFVISSLILPVVLAYMYNLYRSML
jgi:hypothetical protein